MKALLLILALLGIVPAFAQGTTTGQASVFVANDSDDFNILKLAAAYLPLIQSGNDYTAVRLYNSRYWSSDWSINATQASVEKRVVDQQSGLGYQAGLGLSDLAGRQLVTADLDYSTAWSPSTNAGFFYNRDWVETRQSLDNGIHHDYLGGSLEQSLATGWTVIGLLAQQRFSDNNNRSIIRARLIYDWMPQQGINLQYRHRHFWDSQAANGNYFNPDVYSEDMLVLGLRRRFAGWQIAAALGAGSQRVSNDQDSPTHLAELEVNSPMESKMIFKSRWGVSDSAAINGPNYIYRFLRAELIFAF